MELRLDARQHQLLHPRSTGGGSAGAQQASAAAAAGTSASKPASLGEDEEGEVHQRRQVRAG